MDALRAEFGTKRFSAEYQRESVLSKALFGEVLACRRTANGDRVAVKKMRARDVLSRRSSAIAGRRISVREDALFEIRTLDTLTAEGAPHVVRLLDCFVDSDTGDLCVVMPLFDKDLFWEIEQGGPLGMDRAQRLFAQIVLAVQALHRRGIAHRDLSLENVCVSRQDASSTRSRESGNQAESASECHSTGERAALCDLGLAMSVCDTPGEGKGESEGADAGKAVVRNAARGRVGKAFYVAPEVHTAGRNGVYDALAADAWSLGVMLFIALCGVPPVEEPCAARDARYKYYVSRGRLEQMVAGWNMRHRFDTDSLDLLTRLLEVRPERRATIDEVVHHVWLRKHVALAKARLVPAETDEDTQPSAPASTPTPAPELASSAASVSPTVLKQNKSSGLSSVSQSISVPEPASAQVSDPGVTLEPELELPAAMANVGLSPATSCESACAGEDCSDDDCTAVAQCTGPASPPCMKAAKRQRPPTAPSPPVAVSGAPRSYHAHTSPADEGVDGRPNRVLRGHHKVALFMMNKLTGAGISLW